VEPDDDVGKAMRNERYFPAYVPVVEHFEDDVTVWKIIKDSVALSLSLMRVDLGSYSLTTKTKVGLAETGYDPNLGHGAKGTGFQWRTLSLTASTILSGIYLFGKLLRLQKGVCDGKSFGDGQGSWNWCV
jgi:hypothetical protein